MYGLIGKFTAVEGQRDALMAILSEGMKDMPGCHSYVVARDPSDHHQASLQLASVQAAIAKGRPLIAGMDRIAETIPHSGIGLAVEPI
jgi:quinol monooxygenase YgiN